jgi:hypothetical protein
VVNGFGIAPAEHASFTTPPVTEPSGKKCYYVLDVLLGALYGECAGDLSLPCQSRSPSDARHGMRGRHQGAAFAPALRSSRRHTVAECQGPPRAVRTPRAFSAAASWASVAAPALRAASM